VEDDTKEGIKKTRTRFAEIETAGYGIEKIGRSFVQEGRKGNATLDFLEQELPKYEKIARESPEVAEALAQVPEWLKVARNQADESIVRLRTSEHALLQALSYAVTGVTSTNSISSSIASAIGIAEVTNPRLINIYEKFNLQDFTAIRDPEYLHELSGLLDQEDPALEKARRGAWETLESGSAAALSQAAHSMREVLTKLISKYASNDDVKRCPWWARAPDAKDGVSLAQRLRCLIYGASNRDPSSGEVEILDREIKRYDRAYDCLKGVAHLRSGADRRLVETEMRTLERLIFTVLKRRAQEQATDKA